MAKTIELTQNKVAVIDDCDFENLLQYKWHYAEGYARRARYIPEIQQTRVVRMHQQILGFPNSIIDHINGDGLDNRRSNLRVCTNIENAQNSSKKTNKTSIYKGVHFDKSRDRWRASIRVDKKLVHLGWFFSELEAAKTYDDAAIKYFGKFAKTNRDLNLYGK